MPAAVADRFCPRVAEAMQRLATLADRDGAPTRRGRVDRRQKGHAIPSLANGDGLAYLWPFDPDREKPLVHKPAIPAMLLGPADDVLVLLAGAGADPKPTFPERRSDQI